MNHMCARYIFGAQNKYNAIQNNKTATARYSKTDKWTGRIREGEKITLQLVRRPPTNHDIEPLDARSERIYVEYSN